MRRKVNLMSEGLHCGQPSLQTTHSLNGFISFFINYTNAGEVSL